MKSLRKYTAAALSALLIASAMPFAASAAQADADSGTGEVIRGDVNGDGAVKIDDATTIQRYLAKYVTLTDAQLKAADINAYRSYSGYRPDRGQRGRMEREHRHDSTKQQRYNGNRRRNLG